MASRAYAVELLDLPANMSGSRWYIRAGRDALARGYMSKGTAMAALYESPAQAAPELAVWRRHWGPCRLVELDLGPDGRQRITPRTDDGGAL